MMRAIGTVGSTRFADRLDNDLSFLSLLSLGLYTKTGGTLPDRAVHCINLLYLCHKVKPHPFGWGFILSDDEIRKSVKREEVTE